MVLFASVSAFQPQASHRGYSLGLSAVKKAAGKAAPTSAAASAKKAPASKKAAINVCIIFDNFSRKAILFNFNF